MGYSEAPLCVDLFRELRHFGATNRAGSPHHVATLYSLLHGSLVVWNGSLLFAFHAKHFSQSIFPPFLCDELFVARREAIKGFGNLIGEKVGNILLRMNAYLLLYGDFVQK